MRPQRIIGLLLPLLVLPPVVAAADHYYYGVAADDFLPDNDTLWAALEVYPEWDSSRAVLRDNWNVWDAERDDGRDTVYDDLEWYADSLASGDVFMFAYMGHGGWGAVDYVPDEGSTPRPSSNDPSPDDGPPYEYDEWLPPPSGGNSYVMWDDDITDTFADFNSGVEVIVISGACHSGGWVGGSHDIDHSTPADNNGLYAILGAPEQGTGIGVGPQGGPYEILLTTALSNSLDPYMTMSAWYQAAMGYGETNYYYMQRAWDSSPHNYYYWPEADWVPTAHQQTYYDLPAFALDHWGWEETYLQLWPEHYSTLDAEHDYLMGTPEPATTTALLVGMLGIAVKLRRRKVN